MGFTCVAKGGAHLCGHGWGSPVWPWVGFTCVAKGGVHLCGHGWGSPVWPWVGLTCVAMGGAHLCGHGWGSPVWPWVGFTCVAKGGAVCGLLYWQLGQACPNHTPSSLNRKVTSGPTPKQRSPSSLDLRKQQGTALSYAEVWWSELHWR